MPTAPGDSAASWPAWLPRDLYPFHSRRLELDGASVHYVDEGPAEEQK